MNFVLKQLTDLSDEHKGIQILEFHDILNSYFDDILLEPKITRSNSLIKEVEFDYEDLQSTKKLDLQKYGELKSKVKGYRSKLQVEISKLKEKTSGATRDQSLAILSSFDERWFSMKNVRIQDEKPVICIWGVKPKHFPDSIKLDPIKVDLRTDSNEKEEDSKKEPFFKNPFFVAITILILSISFLKHKDLINYFDTQSGEQRSANDYQNNRLKNNNARNLVFSGTVRDLKNNLPISNSQVKLLFLSNSDQSFPRNTITNDKGEFFFYKLGYGSYRLVMEKKGYDQISRLVVLSKESMSKTVKNARYIPIIMKKQNILKRIFSKLNIKKYKS